jgi:hypothetical protein
LSANKEVRIEPHIQEIRYEEVDESILDKIYFPEEPKMKEAK